MSPPDTDREAALGIFKNLPAFCLGNSPRLPADLSCLKDKFTVGVNRILKSGFCPTVILWVDGNIYRIRGHVTEDGHAMDRSDAVLVCDKSVAVTRYHHGLQTWIGDNALKRCSTSTELCCNGSTGTCAARWMLALGCNPVYLVGMDARYKDGVSDFYGDNPWHHRTPGDNGTLSLMNEELRRLQQDFEGRVLEVVNQEHLEEVAGGCTDVNQDNLKAAVRAVVSS